MKLLFSNITLLTFPSYCTCLFPSPLFPHTYPLFLPFSPPTITITITTTTTTTTTTTITTTTFFFSANKGDPGYDFGAFWSQTGMASQMSMKGKYMVSTSSFILSCSFVNTINQILQFHLISLYIFDFWLHVWTVVLYTLVFMSICSLPIYSF